MVNPAIAAGKKCWCCEKLSDLINPVSIPRSHGIIYPWCPPRIGIDLAVLEALEKQLWARLYEVLKEKHQSSTHSCRSSESSLIDDSECISIIDEIDFTVDFSDVTRISITDTQMVSSLLLL